MEASADAEMLMPWNSAEAEYPALASVRPIFADRVATLFSN